MKFPGKILGTIIGMIILGPIGLLLGFIVGHLYDIGFFRTFLHAASGSIHTQAQEVFFNNTFKIMGYIAKSDGQVSNQEIQAARDIMFHMGLNAEQREQAMRLFYIGKQEDFPIQDALSELKQVFYWQPALLQLFLEIQWKMASAEEYVSAAKKAALENICASLGIPNFQFTKTRSQQRSYSQQEYNYQQHQQQQHHRRHRTPTRSDALSMSDACQILGISQHVTQDELKKAYRKLMSQNHPDKLIAKGLPPEMIKLATEKTQKIKQAYERVKTAKGW